MKGGTLHMNDDNFEVIIYYEREFPKLQNDALFIEIDQCKHSL